MPTRPAAPALHVDPRVALAIVLGGALGAVARHGLLEALPFAGHSWPWATFAANLAGTAVLGLLLAAAQHLPVRAILLRPFLGAGFCGALTTFSAFQLELIRLGRNGHAALAAGYAGASLAGGLALAAIGWHAIARARARGGSGQAAAE
jgi:CrcB protein